MYTSHQISIDDLENYSYQNILAASTSSKSSKRLLCIVGISQGIAKFKYRVLKSDIPVLTTTDINEAIDKYNEIE